MKGIIEYVIRSVPFNAIPSTIHNLINRLFFVFLTGRCPPLSMKAQSSEYFHRVTQAPMFPVNATGTRTFSVSESQPYFVGYDVCSYPRLVYRLRVMLSATSFMAVSILLAQHLNEQIIFSIDRRNASTFHP